MRSPSVYTCRQRSLHVVFAPGKNNFLNQNFDHGMPQMRGKRRQVAIFSVVFFEELFLNLKSYSLNKWPKWFSKPTPDFLRF